MEISKVLKVESPVHLWRIIDCNPELIDQAEGNLNLMLRKYFDSGYEYQYGCPCEEEYSWARFLEEYNICSKDPDVQSHMCQWLNCDRVDFLEQ